MGARILLGARSNIQQESSTSSACVGSPCFIHIRTNKHPHDLTYKYNFILLETIELELRAIPSDNDVNNHDSNRVTLVIQQRPRLSKILFQIRNGY